MPHLTFYLSLSCLCNAALRGPKFSPNRLKSICCVTINMVLSWAYLDFFSHCILMMDLNIQIGIWEQRAEPKHWDRCVPVWNALSFDESICLLAHGSEFTRLDQCALLITLLWHILSKLYAGSANQHLPNYPTPLPNNIGQHMRNVAFSFLSW